MHIFVLTTIPIDLKQILPSLPMETTIHRLKYHPDAMSRRILLGFTRELLNELPPSFNALDQVLVIMESTPNSLAAYSMLNFAFVAINLIPQLLVLNDSKTMYLEFSMERAEAIDWMMHHFLEQKKDVEISKLEKSND